MPIQRSSTLSVKVCPRTRGQLNRSDLAHFTAWGGPLPATADQVARLSGRTCRQAGPCEPRAAGGNLEQGTRSKRLVQPLPQRNRPRYVARDQARERYRPRSGPARLLREDLFLILDVLRDEARAQRDRALLLIGWAGGFRTSELVGLDWSDVEEVREGLVLHLRRSKTDQMGQGRKIGVPFGRTRHCPRCRAFRVAKGQR